MSTRSATIIRQTTYWGEQAETEEVMRFYRHCDGYPEGHGMEMAKAIRNADYDETERSYWIAGLLKWFLTNNPYATNIEFEDRNSQHGDLEYLYVIDGTVDRRLGMRGQHGRLQVTISVYETGWDVPYSETIEREPIFSGSADEYIDRFGR